MVQPTGVFVPLPTLSSSIGRSVAQSSAMLSPSEIKIVTYALLLS